MAGEKNMNPELEWESLIAAHLRNELSQAEHDRLMRWVGENEAHRQQYEGAVKAWNLSKEIDSKFSVDTEAAWVKVKQRTLAPNALEPASGFWYTFWTNPIYKAAAAILLLLVSSLALNVIVFKPVKTIMVASGNETKMIVMPDSTQIWLNKNSRLKYTVEYNNSDRQVYLDGEAFFEVKHNQDKPFIVNGIRSVTEVRGTSFSVYTRQEDREEHVEVKTGRVLFRPVVSTSYGEGAVLSAGDRAVLDAYMHVSTGKVKANAFAWKESKLEFSNATLKEVAAELSNYFGVPVELGKGLDTCRFTGSFNQPKIEHVLEVLTVSSDLTWKKDSNQYSITGK